MKSLLGLLVGCVLAPSVMAGVAIASPSMGGLNPTLAWAGGGSSKTVQLEAGGAALSSPKALGGNAVLRQGSDHAAAAQIMPVAMYSRAEGPPSARSKRADRQVGLLPSGPDSSHESYAMMAAGLCAIGFLARRRKLV